MHKPYTASVKDLSHNEKLSYRWWEAYAWPTLERTFPMPVTDNLRAQLGPIIQSACEDEGAIILAIRRQILLLDRSFHKYLYRELTQIPQIGLGKVNNILMGGRQMTALLYAKSSWQSWAYFSYLAWHSPEDVRTHFARLCRDDILHIRQWLDLYGLDLPHPDEVSAVVLGPAETSLSVLLKA